MPGVLHALCNGHHLRELKTLIDIEKEAWARKMPVAAPRRHAVNLARERGSPLSPRLIALIERRYDAFVAEGLAFHETQAPSGRAGNRAAASRVEPNTICCCVSPVAGMTSCASSPIRTSPSPTIRPNSMHA
jgi:hypothetical protein